MRRPTALALTLTLTLAGLLAPTMAPAQDSETLADIRQQLSMLYVEVQGLRSQLNTTAFANAGVAGNTPLERLDSIEAQLQRLTSKTEELENRINRITVDGTNRIGDLEFRLCEIEPGCDIGALGETPSLGGVDSAAQVPIANPPPVEGPELAVGEEEDYRRAQEALANGDFRSAADLFAAFVAAWPGGPLTAQADFNRGAALDQLGETGEAARAYLDSFSGAPTGPKAPQALFRLGRGLGRLGQTADACVTLGEVGKRFPAAPEVAEAQAAMRDFGCP